MKTEHAIDWRKTAAEIEADYSALCMDRDEKAERIRALEVLAERLKQEAQIHAQEARTANATIAEIYQAVTGSTGEPGNWNGARPVVKKLRALEDENAELKIDSQNAIAYEGLWKQWQDKAIALEAQRDELRQQLAAAQLQIKQYREALENCRLLAARHRKEEWAAHVLRFCGDAGVIGSPIRNTDTAVLDQIKASYEAQIKVLREALKVAGKNCVDDFIAAGALQLADAKQDTAAIEALIAKAGEVMRGRAAGACIDRSIGTDVDDYNEWDFCNYSCAEAIRALPGVTFNDLKGGA